MIHGSQPWHHLCAAESLKRLDALHKTPAACCATLHVKMPASLMCGMQIEAVAHSSSDMHSGLVVHLFKHCTPRYLVLAASAEVNVQMFHKTDFCTPQKLPH